MGTGLSGKVPFARLEALAIKRAAKGLTTPMVDSRPELFEDLQPAWDGWEALSVSRAWRTDGEPSGLLHTEIQAWLDLNRLEDPGLRHDLYKMIQAMDLLWLGRRKQRLDAKGQETRGNPSSSHRGPKRTRRS